MSCSATDPMEAWLIGDWAPLNSVGYDTCSYGEHVTYSADLTYRAYGERGRWSIEATRLTETPTDIDMAIVPAEAGPVGQPWISTIEKLSDDRFRKTYARGNAAEFRRCPSPAARRSDTLG